MNFFKTTLCVLPCAMTSVALAQTGGPYAPYSLMLPFGARTLALGNTGVVSRDDDVLFFNPAQLMVARGTSASIERYSSTSGGGALSSVTRLANSALAIGVSVVDYTPQDVVIPSITPSTGFSSGPVNEFSTFPATRQADDGPGSGEGTSFLATVGYARTIKGVRLGAAAKYAVDETQDVRIGRAALDVGLAKDLFRYYQIGLSVQNIGSSSDLPCTPIDERNHTSCVFGLDQSSTERIELPLRTTLGGSFSHQLGELDFVGTAAASMLRDSYFIPSGGGELSYSWIDGYDVALRGGLRRPLPGEGTVTGGFGFTADRISIDYALELLGRSRVAHRVGFRIR